MESTRSRHASLLLWAVVAALLSHNFVISTPNFDDNKNYYTPDPNRPTVPHIIPPPHGSGGGGHPHHGTPPSHGGGGSPPANCGTPPSGGHHHTNPSPPTGGGGGYYHSPPTTTPVVASPPPIITPPVVASPPPIITPPVASSPPIITPPVVANPPPIITPPVVASPPPVIGTPIINPGTPSTPGITIPSPPFPFDPNSPPFTCTYWRNHPTLIWGLFGWWGTTVGSAFGVTSLPGVGANMNILQALSDTHSDGLGQLYREGTAALLNSVAHTRFPYTSNQVRDRFVAALSSNKAAAEQAQLFKHANEGKTKPRA